MLNYIENYQIKLERTMTKERIQELIDFFFSSNDSNEVPLRIGAITGQYSMFVPEPEALAVLLDILENSTDLKTDLLKFREEYAY